MRTAYFFIALLGTLHFLLSVVVSITRIRTRRSQGHDPDPKDFLHKAVVAQRNAAEYIPILCLLMLTLQYYGSANWVVWVYLGSTLGRYFHAIGILTYPTMARPNMFRRLGAVLTYLGGLGMALGLLVQVLLTPR